MVRAPVVSHLSLLAIIAAAGSCSPKTVAAGGCSDSSLDCAGSPLPACRSPDPQRLFRFADPGRLLRYGGIVRMGDAWVIAGSEENTLAPLEEVDDFTPRVFLVTPDRVQTLPLPRAAVRSPVPVLLADDRWGIVWATVDPPAAYAERWIEGLYTDLWWAEWTPGGWSEPIHLIRADLGLEWDQTRVLRHGPDGAVVLMVTGRGDDLRRKLFFGELRAGLRALPIGDAPLFGSFLLAPAQKARVFVADRNVAARTVDIREATVDIPAGTADAPTTIVRLRMSEVGGGLQALQDGAGRAHLLWSNQDLTRVHGLSRNGDGEWERDDPGAPDGLLFQWVAGVAAGCDRAAIYAMVRDRAGSFRLRVSRWECGWGDYGDEYPSQIGIYPLDGTASDGSWLVGWGGEGGADSIPEYGFWTLRP